MKRISNSATWMTNIERGRLQVLSKGKGTWMINMQMDNQPYKHGGPTCKANMLITFEKNMRCKEELDNGTKAKNIFWMSLTICVIFHDFKSAVLDKLLILP